MVRLLSSEGLQNDVFRGVKGLSTVTDLVLFRRRELCGCYTVRGAVEERVIAEPVLTAGFGQDAALPGGGDSLFAPLGRDERKDASEPRRAIVFDNIVKKVEELAIVFVV